jgi:3-oxoacyl-[acyl-carrier protein] reductase
LSEEDWDRCMRIDLKSAWLCSKHAVPHMTGGSIINIASTHPLRTQPNYLPYVVAKGGVLALTLSIAVDFGPRGIRVNSLCPGFIETPLSEHVLAQWKQSPEIYEAVLATHPLRRLGKPKDVACAATFLASDESSFITGTTLIVDGGRMAYGYSFGDTPSRR